MNSINHSIIFLLRHSLVSLLLVVTLLIFFSFFHIFVINNHYSPVQSIGGALIINLTMSVFFGSYLGGALLSLKQHHLWKINKHYRHSLLAAFLITLAAMSILQMPLFYLNKSFNWYMLLVPFCIAIFASQLVLGRTLIHKFLICSVPFLIYQLLKFEISTATTVLVLVTSTILLIVSMYTGTHQIHKSHNPLLKTQKNNNTTTQTFKRLWLEKINHRLGQIALRLSPSRVNLNCAILRPHTILALLSIAHILLIMLLVNLNQENRNQLITGFAPMFLATALINMIMESKKLMKQIKSIAHVFKNHKSLKTHILYTIDKAFIIHAIIFSVGMFLLTYFTAGTFNILMFYMLLTTLVLALCFYPILMCMSWINISFALVTVVMIYALMIFYVNRFVKDIYQNHDILIYLFGFIIAGFVIRLFSQHLFFIQPIDKLFKN